VLLVKDLKQCVIKPSETRPVLYMGLEIAPSCFVILIHA